MNTLHGAWPGVQVVGWCLHNCHSGLTSPKWVIGPETGTLAKILK
jgi:hypothetical protein